MLAIDFQFLNREEFRTEMKRRSQKTQNWILPLTYHVCESEFQTRDKFPGFSEESLRKNKEASATETDSRGRKRKFLKWIISSVNDMSSDVVICSPNHFEK